MTGTIKNGFMIGRRNPQSQIVLVISNARVYSGEISLVVGDELNLALDLLFAYFM